MSTLVQSPTGTTTYKLDQYRSESKVTPFVLDTGSETIVIPPPTGETVLTIGETPTYETRALLKLLCGEVFDAVWAAVKDEPAGVLVGLLNDIGKHFVVMAVSEVPGGFGASPS